MAPFLSSLYTSDFRHNTDTCHLQKYADDSAIVASVSGGQEMEYRGLVNSFVQWCKQNHLLLNIAKTKEILMDFRKKGAPPLSPVTIGGEDVEVVQSYKYLGVQLDNKLDWTGNTDVLYKKGQSRLYFLRRLSSFGVCRTLLNMFYQSVVASSTILYWVVCWGG